MNTSLSSDPFTSRRQAGFTGLQVAGLMAAAVFLTAGISLWIARTYLWPADFEPVELTQPEQVVLDDKLRALGVDLDTITQEPKQATQAAHPSRTPRAGTDAANAQSPPPAPMQPDEEWLRPAPYSEDAARREIGLSERELNALLAHNTDLAHRLSVDLSDDLASAKLLVPIDPDFPILGGKTLRVAAGLELAYTGERPVVVLRGISLMGVPIPSAWLGHLKNVDLVDQFGGGPGFWRSFSDGIELIRISDGELKIKLAE